MTRILLGLCLVAGCLHDPHSERARLLDRHLEAFQAYLAGGLPDAAMEENVRIEAIAAELSMAVMKRGEVRPVDETDEDRRLYERATETAAGNWLALAEHWAANGDSARAGRTYRRVLEVYTGARFESSRDRAREALQELEEERAGRGGRREQE